MPGRLGASYIAEDGSKQAPVMLHRAILGSLERFIGILIEQHAGTFPVWLSPVQAMVLDIADRHADYASQIMRELEQQGIRVKIDLRNEKIGFKIREHSMQRVPYLVIIGDKELEDQTITVRTQKGEDLGSLSISEFTERLKQEIADRK
jgi:threonyl-tRNA synthetase